MEGCLLNAGALRLELLLVEEDLQMFGRSCLIIAVSLFFTLTLNPCGQDMCGNRMGESSKTLLNTVKAPPPQSINEARPRADQVSLVITREPRPMVEVVKTLMPSVVQIVADALATGSSNQLVASQRVGTGIILDDQGHILTNNHVVAGAQRITVILQNGDSFPAEVVGGEASTDVAVVRIEAHGLQPAKLGDSSGLQLGEEVIAAGYALGLQGDPTISKGVVSALGRSIQTEAQTTMVDMIQTDAAINPGNSGGPLVNTGGEVVGINTAIIESHRGVGLAIPISDAKIVAAQLIGKRYVARSSVGIPLVNR